MDHISLKGLKVFAYHGVFEEEKRAGQNFYIDADLFLNLGTAGRSDDLNKSVNYGSVAETIHDFVSKECFDLIETVAEKTAIKILTEYPLIERIVLSVHKPQAPINFEFSDVSVNIERAWHKAYVALGSNMGDRKQYIDNAIKSLEKDPMIKDIELSELIESEPYGGVIQENFLNGAVAVKTIYTPEELLDAIQAIEKENKRERLVHWGPRTLDLDILFYDNVVMDTPRLVIPHPDMENRTFVLEPLMDLCPYYRHPINGLTVENMLEKLKTS